MDFDTIHRENVTLYPKLHEESLQYVPQMKYEGGCHFPLEFSSSSHGSGRILRNLDNHLNVPNSGFYTTFHDPFDPFQASYNGLNQEFNDPTSFAQDTSGAQIVHGSKCIGVLDLGSRTHFQAMDPYEIMNESLLGVDDNLQMDSRLVLEEGSKRDTRDDKHDQGKGEVQKKRKRIVDKKSEIIKGQWTTDEDRLLVELVEKHGVRKWSSIAQMLPGRIGKQCRERWHNHLKPNIKKDRWSEEEDKILIEAHRNLGNKWAEIARSLPGRSENTIKNHWNATKRKQLSSRKKNNPKSTTPLQNYIKSVLSSSSSSKDNYQENFSSSSSTSPIGDDALMNSKQEKNCSKKLNKDQNHGVVNNVVEESFKLPPLDTQIHMQFDLQKEIDFMEMLSYGYI